MSKTAHSKRLMSVHLAVLMRGGTLPPQPSAEAKTAILLDLLSEAWGAFIIARITNDHDALAIAEHALEAVHNAMSWHSLTTTTVHLTRSMLMLDHLTHGAAHV